MHEDDLKIFYIAHFDCTIHEGHAAHVRSVVNSFDRLGHKVWIFAKGWRSPVESSVCFVFVPQWMRPGFYTISFALAVVPIIIWYLLVHRPDLVYARFFNTLFIVAWICRLFRVPFFVELNADVPAEHVANGRSKTERQFWDWSERTLYRHAVGLIAVAEAIAESVRSRFLTINTPIKVIENGVDTEIFFPQDSLICREHLSLESAGPYIVFVGAFQVWQGLDTLLDAAPSVLARYPNCQIFLVGARPSEVSAIRDKIAARGLSAAQIRVYPRQPEKIAACFIGAADICVAPYNLYAAVDKDDRNFGAPMKGSPLKIFSYLACGRSVIASHFHEAGAFLASTGTGIAVPPDDAIALQEAILSLLEAPELRQSMGEAGYQLVKQHHSWLAVSAKIIHFLHEIIESRAVRKSAS